MLGYEGTITNLKSQGKYLPTVPSRNYISELLKKEKDPYCVAQIREMSATSMNSKIINSKMIHHHLLSDITGCESMPAEFNKDMRSFTLNIINSLSGGEFDQMIQEIVIKLAAM
jgi:hypothetical protein